MRQRTTIYLDETDRAAIQAIRQDNGLSSDADAIRYAVHQVAKKSAKAKKGGQDEKKLYIQTVPQP